MMKNGKKMKRPLWIKGLCLLCVVLTIAGCGYAPQYNAGGQSGGETSAAVSLSVNEFELVLQTESTNVWIDVPMMFADAANRLQFGEFAGLEVFVNDQPVQSGALHEVTLDRLRKDETIQVRIKSPGMEEDSTFYIRTLNYDFPQVDYILSDPSQGCYYTVYDSRWLVKLRTDGEIAFYKDAATSYDFKPVRVDGFSGYTYLQSSKTNIQPLITAKGGYLHSRAVVLDDQYREIDEVASLLDAQNNPIGQPLENHDFMVLGPNHYLVSSYVPKRVRNLPDSVPHSAFGTRVLASVLQEIRDGKLVWQWDSTEHPELYGMSVESNDYFNETLAWNDYVHFNSMCLDPQDGNLVCSFRHLDAVLKLDRKTGEILWILGGKGDQFGLSEEQKFSRQHFANFTEDHKLVLFDNAVNVITSDYPKEYVGAATGISRAMRFELDEKNKRLIAVDSFSVDGQKSTAMGSARQLTDQPGDVFLISWGMRATTNALFSEIDFTNRQVLFEAVYNNPGPVYRVYKSDR